MPEYLHSRHYTLLTPLHATAGPLGKTSKKRLYFYKKLEVTDKTGTWDARYTVTPGTTAT